MFFVSFFAPPCLSAGAAPAAHGSSLARPCLDSTPDSVDSERWTPSPGSAGDFSAVVYGVWRAMADRGSAVGAAWRPGMRRLSAALCTAPELLTFHLIPQRFLSVPASRKSPRSLFSIVVGRIG